MPGIFRDASGACGSPAASRHLHLVAETRLRFRSDLATFGSPHLVVSVPWPHKGVGDFVEKSIENRLVGVPFGKVDG
ncbi:MAG: hypothetical protein U0792_09550 [Gemmataceae bacterium]